MTLKIGTCYCGLTARDSYWSLIGHRIRPFKWDENNRNWITAKVTGNQYGRLS